MTDLLGDPQTTGVRGRAARVAPWAGAGLVLALALGAAVVGGLGGDGRDGGDQAVPGADARSAPPGEYVASSELAYGGAFRLGGELPTDGPTEGRVHRPLDVPAGRVAALAAVLGIEGAPEQVDGSWLVQDDAGRLEVYDGGWWSFGPPYEAVTEQPLPVDGDTATSSGSAGAGSSGAGSSGTASEGATVEGVPPVPAPGVAPPPPPDATNATDAAAFFTEPGTELGVDAPVPTEPLVTEEQARAAAAPVLELLGLTDVQVLTYGGPSRSVQASPTVDGLPVVGLDTTLEVGEGGTLLYGGGSLAEFEAGDAVALLSAQETFDALAASAVAAPCLDTPDVAAACPPPVEQVVTGARAGLVLQDDGTGPALLPAWLFAVEGSDLPVAQSSVAPGEIAPGQIVTEEPPVLVEVPQPLPVEPAPVDPAPGDTVQVPFRVDAAVALSPTELELTWGESGSCPYDAVDLAVVEEADAVLLRAVATTAAGPAFCTDDYRVTTGTVVLTAPLDGREVRDELSGEVLLPAS